MPIVFKTAKYTAKYNNSLMHHRTESMTPRIWSILKFFFHERFQWTAVFMRNLPKICPFHLPVWIKQFKLQYSADFKFTIIKFPRIRMEFEKNRLIKQKSNVAARIYLHMDAMKTKDFQEHEQNGIERSWSMKWVHALFCNNKKWANARFFSPWNQIWPKLITSNMTTN